LQKGKQIFVEGRLRTRQWQDQQGNKRNTTEIVMENMTMLGARAASAGEEMAETVPSDLVPRENADDDVPF
jgi:single-strand DNA-binding protein